MKYVIALVTLLGTAMIAGAGSAQQLSLDQISDYLNDLETAEGEFTQLNADGSRFTGRIFIKRPGRIRFEYNPPADQLVLATGGSIAIFDGRSNTGPERYPLNQTPLGIILARNVDLTREEMVTGVGYDGTATFVRAQDPDNPQYGSLTLVFTPDPVALRQWIVTDDLGNETTTVLDDLETGGRIRDVMFNIQAEMRRREN